MSKVIETREEFEALPVLSVVLVEFKRGKLEGTDGFHLIRIAGNYGASVGDVGLYNERDWLKLWDTYHHSRFVAEATFTLLSTPTRRTQWTCKNLSPSLRDSSMRTATTLSTSGG